MKKTKRVSSRIKATIKESAEKLQGVDNFIPPLSYADDPRDLKEETWISESPYAESNQQSVSLNFLDIIGPIGLAFGFIAFGMVIGMMK